MIEHALNTTFGIICKENDAQIKGLPLYMTAGRTMTEVDIEDCCFLLITLSENDKFGTVALKKQAALYTEKSGLHVAYYFENITKVQRDALVRKRIPFISMPDQMYLPFLGMALSNHFKKEYEFSVKKMMPATQCLFLYLLYNTSCEYMIKKEAAEHLKLTRTSITRASEQLKNMGLLTENARGKEIQMYPTATGKEYYEKAKKYLINPVQKRLSLEKNPMIDRLNVAGESALSKNSMLAAPEKEIYAIYKGHDVVQSWKEINSQWQTDVDSCCVELWKYDPDIFAKNGAVDPVSLAMSLSDIEDERVQSELETYLEEYAW